MTRPFSISLLLCTSALLVSNSLASADDQPAPRIPADAQKAAQALKDSPRHREWIDIAIPGADTKLHTWVVYPERKDKAPVVLVIHEIFGMTDWIRAVADQLAAEGFIAVAPDLLSGKGPGGGGTESFSNDAVIDAVRKLADDEVVQRLNAAREYAIALPAASARTASIGFCWGGSASFKYAAAQGQLNAAVVYYGTGPMKDQKPDLDALAKIDCPVLGLYGGSDARVTLTVEPTATAMADLKKSFVHHEYEGAGHGFLRQQIEPGGGAGGAAGGAGGAGGAADAGGANLKAARQAWSQTISFLNTSLQSHQDRGNSGP